MPSPTPFPGLPTPGAGFDQPFEMLHACHDRVRRSLALLQRLVAHVQQHGADTQARDAARDVRRYFDVAAPAHHEDEERHVIPRLLASAEPALQATGRRMQADHEAMRAGWAALAPLLGALAEGQRPAPDVLAQAAGHFVELHREHLALEDSVAFPAAQQHLAQAGGAALAAMGDEMAARRGVRAPRG